MEKVKFLNVTIPEATDALEDCMNRGYAMLNRIRKDFDENKENPNSRDEQWQAWFHEWGGKTISNLTKIYINPWRVNYFAQKVSREPSYTSDTAITRWETTTATKIEVLKDYYDFIMSTSI